MSDSPKVTGDTSSDGIAVVPMSAPDITESDAAAVDAVLRSGHLSIGPMTIRFEEQCAALADVPHAVAVSSGTAALHLIVRALGLGPGSEVLVPSFTFAASANALIIEGVRPVFVDIERDTYNLDPADLERRVTARTQAIMVVDIFGHSAEWDAITDVAERHDLALIDDSCEAIGGRHRGRALGGFGAAGAFAFYPNKQMTTGEGGMILTHDAVLAALCRSMRNRGRGEMGLWLEHERLGFNYRMDEMSAALGVSQIKRLPEMLRRRAEVAARYDRLLAGLEWVRPPEVRSHVDMSWFVYVVTLKEGIDRDAVMAYLEQRGIPTRAYFPPLHQQPYMIEMLGGSLERLPITESIAKRTLALPFFGNLTETQAERVVTTLREAVERTD